MMAVPCAVSSKMGPPDRRREADGQGGVWKPSGSSVVEDVYVEAVLAVPVACGLAPEPPAAYVDRAVFACGQQRQVGFVLRYGQQRAVDLDHLDKDGGLGADPRACADRAGCIVHLLRQRLQVEVRAEDAFDPVGQLGTQRIGQSGRHREFVRAGGYADP